MRETSALSKMVILHIHKLLTVRVEHQLANWRRTNCDVL